MREIVVNFSLVESTSFPLISYIETVFIASIVLFAELNVKLFSSNPFKRRFLIADVVNPNIDAYSDAVNLKILSITSNLSYREFSRNIWTDPTQYFSSINVVVVVQVH